MSTYRLYIDGQPQNDYTNLKPKAAADENEKFSDAESEGYRPGYEWRREDRPDTGTPFEVLRLDGTLAAYASHPEYTRHLRAGGMVEYCRRFVQYMKPKQTRRAA